MTGNSKMRCAEFKTIQDNGGYLEGWRRLGIGIVDVEKQRAFLRSQDLSFVQVDFHKGYGASPKNDMSFLQEFPEIGGVACDASFMESKYINGLKCLKSFRDSVFLSLIHI